MTIKILVTGGTFDKEYDEIEEKLVFKETHLQNILKQGRCEIKVNIRTLMLIDSLHMTTADRQLILENCKKSEEDKIVITHGTGTMEDTARFLNKNIKNKTIVLTGAMVPYIFGSSDGLFNLGSAISFAQSLPHGVYIAMNGRYFNADNVTKNTKTGKFEEIR
ncbi:asparaginase [Candidatus Woesearchaeota archaeon]|nr:asparaginase [Candidatus Woesearchaeota archaeon]